MFQVPVSISLFLYLFYFFIYHGLQSTGHYMKLYAPAGRDYLGSNNLIPTHFMQDVNIDIFVNISNCLIIYIA